MLNCKILDNKSASFSINGFDYIMSIISSSRFSLQEKAFVYYANSFHLENICNYFYIQDFLYTGIFLTRVGKRQIDYKFNSDQIQTIKILLNKLVKYGTIY